MLQKLTICIVIGSLAATPALANKRDLHGQVSKLLRSGDQKSYVDGRHKFKMKTVVFQETGTPGEYYVDGRLTHDIRFRPDDIFHFCMTMNRAGELLEFKTAIKRGGFTSMLNKSYRLSLGRAADDTSGKLDYAATGRRTTANFLDLKSATAQGLVRRIGQGFGTAIEGDWVPSASKAVAEIAIQSSRAIRTGQPAVQIVGQGAKLDERIINRCPRRVNRGLH